MNRPAMAPRPHAPTGAPAGSPGAGHLQMTSTATTAAAQQGGAPVRRAATARGRRPARSTPTQMRRLAALGLLAGTLTGAAGFAALDAADTLAANRVAAAARAQALSGAQADIAAARASALSAALAGGTSGTATARYERSITQIGAAVAKISTVSNNPTTDLRRPIGDLTTYAAAIGKARGEGSGGVPTLTAADQSADAAAAQIAAATDRAVRDASGSTSPLVATALGVGLLGTAATVGLLGCSVWLSRRTHRLINPPLALAVLLSAGVTVGAVSATNSAAAPIAAAQAAVTGTAATDRDTLVLAGKARAHELLDLAAGSKADTTSATRFRDLVAGRLSDRGNSELASLWRTYADTAARSSTPTSGAQNVQARTNAVGAGEAAYDAVASALTTRAGTPILTTPPTGLSAQRWLLLFGGVLAGGLSIAGFGLRLREYRR